MPCSWINYQVKTANIDGEVDTYYINIPTTDTTYAVADETKLAGYVNPVCIGVVAKANWTGSDDQLRDFGSKAGENANYVFTTSRMNGIIPSDLSTSITNTILNQVMGSFKLL